MAESTEFWSMEDRMEKLLETMEILLQSQQNSAKNLEEKIDSMYRNLEEKIDGIIAEVYGQAPEEIMQSTGVKLTAIDGKTEEEERSILATESMEGEIRFQTLEEQIKNQDAKILPTPDSTTRNFVDINGSEKSILGNNFDDFIEVLDDFPKLKLGQNFEKLEVIGIRMKSNKKLGKSWVENATGFMGGTIFARKYWASSEIIRLCVKKRSPGAAIWCLQIFPQVDTVLYTIMIEFGKKRDLALDVYRIARHSESRGNLKLDVFTYSTMSKVLADARRWKMALEIKEDMLLAGDIPNSVTWLNGVHRKWAELVIAFKIDIVGSVKIWKAYASEVMKPSDTNCLPFYLLKEVITIDSGMVPVLSLIRPLETPEEIQLAIGRGSGSLEVWIGDLDSCKFEKGSCSNAHEHILTGLAWAIGGNCLYNCSQDGTIRSWILQQSILSEVPFPSNIPGVRSSSDVPEVSSCVFALNTGGQIVYMLDSHGSFLLFKACDGMNLSAQKLRELAHFADNFEIVNLIGIHTIEFKIIHQPWAELATGFKGGTINVIKNSLQWKVASLCIVVDGSLFLPVDVANLCKTSYVIARFPGLQQKGAHHLQAIASANFYSMDRVEVPRIVRQQITLQDTIQLVRGQDKEVYFLEQRRGVAQLQVMNPTAEVEVLRGNHLFARLSKCSCAQTQVESPGHIISTAGVSLDTAKVDGVLNWPIPSTVKALKGFLELTSYYRRYVQHYGVISKSLTDLLKKNSLHWSPEVYKACIPLKKGTKIYPICYVALEEESWPSTCHCCVMPKLNGRISNSSHSNFQCSRLEDKLHLMQGKLSRAPGAENFSDVKALAIALAIAIVIGQDPHKDAKNLVLGGAQMTARLHRLDEGEEFRKYRLGSMPSGKSFDPKRPKILISKAREIEQAKKDREKAARSGVTDLSLFEARIQELKHELDELFGGNEDQDDDDGHRSCDCCSSKFDENGNKYTAGHMSRFVSFNFMVTYNDDKLEDTGDEHEKGNGNSGLSIEEIRQVCSYRVDLKKDFAEEMRRSVYFKYSSFMWIPKEISDLEGELSSMRNLLSTQAIWIRTLSEDVQIGSWSDSITEDYAANASIFLRIRLQMLQYS